MSREGDSSAIAMVRGKRVMLVTAAAGALVLAAAVYALRPWFVEEYWLWKLRNGEVGEKDKAAQRLGELRSVRAVPALLELLEQEPFRRVDAVGLRAVGRLVRGGQTTRSRGFTYVLSHAGEAIVKIGALSIPELTRGLESDDGKVREAIVLILGRLGTEAKPAVQCLVRALDDPEIAVARRAADALGEIGAGAEAAVSALVRAMNEGHDDVRWTAANALARIGPDVEGTVAALVNRMQTGDARSRWIGVYGLRNMGSGSVAAIPALIRALEDPDENVRYYAAITLGRIGRPAEPAIPALEEIPADDRNVWKAATEALARISHQPRAATTYVGR